MNRPAVFVALAVGPLTLFAACSFPEVSFTEPPAPEAGVDGFVNDGMRDGAASDGDGARPRPKDVDPDGGAGDAATRGDATIERPDAEAGAVGCAGAGGPPCDCDSDKALNG